MLGQSFLRLGLVDEIRLMIAPVILGDGLHLFVDSGTEEKWLLKNVVAYKNGFVELSYRINRLLARKRYARRASLDSVGLKGYAKHSLEETSCRGMTGSSGYRITAVGRCW